MPETPTPSKRPTVALSEAEKALVREAVKDVRALPSTLGGEEQVHRALKRRNKLETDILTLYDPRRKARPWIWGGWLLSVGLAVVVVSAALWRALVRFDQPLPGVDEPLAFLAWFGAAFVLAWTPAVIGLLRARAIHRHVASSETPDPTPALTVFDVNVVRGWVKQDDGTTKEGN